jgi:excisionase family DNA binding protein
LLAMNVIASRDAKQRGAASAKEDDAKSEPKRKTNKPARPLAVARKDAARTLGLSIATVERAIRRGDLKAKRCGGRMVVPISEIERYLARLQNVEGPPA